MQLLYDLFWMQKSYIQIVLFLDQSNFSQLLPLTIQERSFVLSHPKTPEDQ